MNAYNKAVKLFKDFHNREPAQGEIMEASGKSTIASVGTLVALAYECDVDGKTETYYHEFNKKSRPALFTSYDGKQLYIVAGQYKFTYRGIEDK